MTLELAKRLRAISHRFDFHYYRLLLDGITKGRGNQMTQMTDPTPEEKRIAETELRDEFTVSKPYAPPLWRDVAITECILHNRAKKEIAELTRQLNEIGNSGLDKLLEANARIASLKEKLEKAEGIFGDILKLTQGWIDAYPPDIFPDPPPGQHGKTVDTCSSRAIKHAMRVHKEDILKLIRSLSPPHKQEGDSEKPASIWRGNHCTLSVKRFLRISLDKLTPVL